MISLEGPWLDGSYTLRMVDADLTFHSTTRVKPHEIAYCGFIRGVLRLVRRALEKAEERGRAKAAGGG